MRGVRYFAIGMCGTALIACNRGREPSMTTTTGAVTPVANSVAVTRIADARCGHERSCNKIGTGRRYISTEACVQKTQADVMSDLNINDCPGGIARRELDACVAAIEAESCANVLDRIGRITACRTGALCLK